MFQKCISDDSAAPQIGKLVLFNAYQFIRLGILGQVFFYSGSFFINGLFHSPNSFHRVPCV